MKKNIKNILKILIALLVFFNISNVLKLILKCFKVDIKSVSLQYMILFQFICSLILFIVIFCMYFSDFKEDFLKFKKEPKKNIKCIIKMFIIFTIIKFLIGVLSAIILVTMGYDVTNLNSTNQILVESYLKASPIIMTITASVLGPLYEEGIFRVGLGKIFKNKYVFIIISGLLFGLLHIFPLDKDISLVLGIIQSISYVTMGIVFGYIYKKTNNIYITIGIHFLNNFLSVLAII